MLAHDVRETECGIPGCILHPGDPDCDGAQGMMPNELQLALLEYSSAKRHLLAVAAKSGKVWSNTIHDLLSVTA